MALLSIIILIGFALGFLIYWNHEATLKRKLSNLPDEFYHEIILFCDDFSGDSKILFFIGSGYGTPVYKLAKNLQTWTVIGIESNPVAWFWSQIQSLWRHSKNVRLFHRGFGQWKGLRQRPSVLVIDVPEPSVKKLEKKLLTALKTGRTVLIYRHPIPSVSPTKTMMIGAKESLYHYDLSSVK